jgi:hypothetical protein
MKLILDDGVFFFANSYTNPNADSGVFMNIDETHGDRISTTNNLLSGKYGPTFRVLNDTGIIMQMFLPSARVIANALDFIIKMLANIEICPDDLFEAYGPKRTRFKKEAIKPNE